MPKEDIRHVGEMGPTINRIEIAEFESRAEAKIWLKQKAPVFLPEQVWRVGLPSTVPERAGMPCTDTAAAAVAPRNSFRRKALICEGFSGRVVWLARALRAAKSAQRNCNQADRPS
jgi:hypothetical protein